MHDREPLLVASGLTRVHRGGEGVTGIDLELRRGDVLCVLGPNGSGKTTLLRALATADPIQGGRCAWFGSGDRRSPAVRRRLGTVLDAVAHFEDMTGYQNAWFFAHRYGVRGDEARRRLHRLLAWAGLGAAVHRRVREYSLGMRRRLALVEALVHEPDVLLMDEPTLGLDWEATLGLIAELRRGRDRGALIATNDVHLVERLRGRVAFLHRGRLVRQGTVESLLAEVDGLQEMELEVRGPMVLQPLLAAPGVRGGAADGGSVRLLLDSKANPAAVLAALNGAGDTVSGMRLRRPDLGDVFLRLTGATLGGERR